jgi:hypothetical protein
MAVIVGASADTSAALKAAKGSCSTRASIVRAADVKP